MKENVPDPSFEQLRLNALWNYKILDTPPEKEFDHFTKLASIICECPVSVISLMDDKRQWFKSKKGLDIQETSREISFCRYTILENDIMEVEDALKDERFKNNEILLESKMRFYAGNPLVDPNGFVLGTLCVMDHYPRRLNEQQKEALKILSEQVMEAIVERNNKPLKLYFENTFQLSDELICIVGQNGLLKKVNPSFERVLGYSNEFLLSHSIFDLIPGDEVQDARDRLRDIILERKNFKFIQCLVAKNGQIKCIAWDAVREPVSEDVFAIGRDITLEREKEEHLKQSEKKFRTFFENSQGLMFTHDVEGNFISANNFGAQLLGYTPEEIIGKNLKEFIPAQHHSVIDEYLREIYEKGKAEGLLTTIHKNGQSRQVWLYNNSLEKTVDGNAYVIGNSIDISERLRLERDIQKTKEMLYETNQMARIGGWKLDVLKNEINWTDVTRSIHEVEDDFVPTPANAIAFFSGIFNTKRINKLFENAIVHHQSWDEKFKIKTAKGREIWVRVKGKPFFTDGVCTIVRGTFHDIDKETKIEKELKRKEQMLLAISKATDELLSNNDFYEATAKSLELLGKAINVDKVYFFQNQTTKNQQLITSHRYEWVCKERKSKTNDPDLQGISLSGIEGLVSVIKQKKALQLYSSQLKKNSPIKAFMNRKKIKSSLILAITNNQEFWGFICFFDFNGDRFWSKGEISLLKSFSNSISNAIDRNFLEKNLVNSKVMAESANKAKSDFLANMSHEIRTPLNGVVGFTDLLLKTDLSKIQQQYLNIVNQSANSLLNTINDILDFSKIEAGKLELDIEKCDIYDLVGQTADVVSFGAHHKGLEMLLNISQELPRYIYLDEIRIKQILINLLGNAIKFTKEGEIELKIFRLQCYIDGNWTYRFEVRDTGIGIAENKQSKIFEAFSQEGESITKKYGGTGLGLSISNKLLDLMGSHLQLNSVPGKGSTFFFDLILESGEGEGLSHLSREGMQKILVVDDNAKSRSIIKNILECRNFEIHEAESGLEAIKQTKIIPDFNIILVDYQMPEMNGLECIRKIKEEMAESQEKIEFIIMHGPSEHETIINSCTRLGITHQLVKPIKLDELYYTLTHLSEVIDQKVEISSSEEDLADNFPYSVLITEDNPTNMLLAKIIIEKIAPNATIAEAHNGLEAIHFCQKSTPSIIFMDIQMPNMNGYEAAKIILQIPECCQVPIIALSAGNVKGEREKSLAVGMVDFVPKPIIQNTLQTIFNKWLRNEDGIPLSTEPITEFPPDNTMVLNVEKIKEYLGDDSEIIYELLQITLGELKEAPQKFINLIQEKNLSHLKEAGHRLKGSCMISGLEKLSEIARSFENLDTLDGHLKGILLPNFLEEIEMAKNEVENYLLHHPSP